MEALQAEHIPWLILLGTAGMLMLIGFIGIFILLYQKRMLNEKQKRVMRELEYQNQMIQLQLDSQEQERKRIGAELHDSLGSLLWGAKVNAALLYRSGNLKDDTLEAYEDLIKILDESIVTIRKIAWELTPEAFQHAGLSDSIRKLCAQLDGKPIHISFTEDNPVHWNDGRALHVFRILQELISNTFKHSGATQLTIVFDWSEENLVVHFSDNGKGIAENPERTGVGLWNVAQRIKQLKASFQISNDADYTGLQIRINVPRKHEP